MKLKLPKTSHWEIDSELRLKWLHWLNLVLFYISLIGFLMFIYDVGFVHQTDSVSLMSSYYRGYVGALFVLLTARLLLTRKIDLTKGLLIAEYVLIILLALGLVFSVFSLPVVEEVRLLQRLIQNNFFSFGVILYVFFVELSKRALTLYRTRFNPALLFVASFVGLILLGTLLLLMPRATTGNLSVLDAIFTSASAVCVTGLVVVDTSKAFTPFGKTIIIVLIQLGGLGIMTFTSFLAMVFQRGSSFQNQLFLKELVNEENLGNTMRTIRNIVAITLGIEALGAILIYASTDRALFNGASEQWAFSCFHSISAFCNAGFSTIEGGLFNPGLRFAYNIHLIIAFLIILGGLGFPIIFNLFKHIRTILKNRWKQYTRDEKYVYPVRVINVNSKLVIITTFILLVAGTASYFLTEFNATLAEHKGMGKMVVAFFGAVTPRTAGFNSVNLVEMTMPTLLIYLLLMWIGGSPGSTAGGMKTTTFAAAVLNTYSIAKGNERVEVFGREIAPKSIRQAFAVMLLSFLVIGLAVLAITLFDPGIPLHKVAFEVFSAFCTVGLSLDLTPLLSPSSKVVIIITMFIGRVGIFTLISIMVTKVNTYYYQYPRESIIIT